MKMAGAIGVCQYESAKPMGRLEIVHRSRGILELASATPPSNHQCDVSEPEVAIRDRDIHVTPHQVDAV
jgi:hypothetical protein